MDQILSRIENMGAYCAIVPRSFTGAEISRNFAELCKNWGRKKYGIPQKLAV